MIKNLLRVPFIFILGVLLVMSCEDRMDSELNPNELTNVQIIKAKAFFEKDIKNTMNFDDAHGRSSKSRKNIRRDLVWEEAYIKDLPIGPAVIVPIAYEENLYTPVSKNFVHTSEKSSYALIYKENNRPVFEMVTSIPEIGSKEDDAVFSGVVLVENWKGDFLKGFKHIDGGVYEMTLDQKTATNGRMPWEICDEEITDWYDCVAVVGIWDWECTYSHSETSSVCVVFSTDGGSCGSCGGGTYDPTYGGGSGDTKPQTADELCGEGMIFNDETGKCEIQCPEGYILNERGKCQQINLNLDFEGYDELTSCEKELVKEFDYVIPQMMRNRDFAHQKTIELFGEYKNGNGHNDCADAFRHAFFNAINTRTWSDSFAKRWGDAHECDTPENELPEKDMDLFNNAIGRSVASEAQNISDDGLANLILVEMEVGNMRYLSPLDQNNNLLPESKLVSTIDCF